MNRHPTVIHGKVYHIYNKGNNREDLFRFPEDYQHFLRLYEKYIEPIAETYSWCLLRNHFHILIRIKSKEEAGFFNPLFSSSTIDSEKIKSHNNDELKWQFMSENEIALLDGLTKEKLKRPTPYRQFSHLFNAYSKYINIKYKRTGSLFEKNFRRICVQNTLYFKQLVIYIHKNPQHHGFTDNFRHYPWSSYQSIISISPTKLGRSVVIGWFDDEARFIELHSDRYSISLDKTIFLE
jgi:REP element-mobilizing transposase RayT